MGQRESESESESVSHLQISFLFLDTLKKAGVKMGKNQFSSQAATQLLIDMMPSL